MPSQLQPTLALPIDASAGADTAGVAARTGADHSFPDLFKPMAGQARAASAPAESGRSDGKPLPPRGSGLPSRDATDPGLPAAADTVAAAVQAAVAQSAAPTTGTGSVETASPVGTGSDGSEPAMSVTAPKSPGLTGVPGFPTLPQSTGAGDASVRSTSATGSAPATPPGAGPGSASHTASGPAAVMSVSTASSTPATAMHSTATGLPGQPAPTAAVAAAADEAPGTSTSPAQSSERAVESPPSRVPDRGLELPTVRSQRVVATESPSAGQGIPVPTSNRAASAETVPGATAGIRSAASPADERGNPQFAQRVGDGPVTRVATAPVNTTVLQAEAGTPAVASAAAATPAAVEAGRRTASLAQETRAMRDRQTYSGTAGVTADRLSEISMANIARNELAVKPKPELIEPRVGIETRYERVPITPPPTPLSNGLFTTAGPQAPGAMSSATLLSINTPVLDPAWSDAVGKQVSMLVSRNVRGAELRLSPAELGPVQVQISVDDNVAKVAFTAGQAVTREALEQALPRLREMLADQGMSLGDASVSDQRGGGPGEGGDSAAVAGYSSEADAAPDAAVPGPVVPGKAAPEGLLDTYA